MSYATPFQVPDRKPDTLRLSDLVIPLLRFKKLLIGLFLFVFLASLAYLLTRQKHFESHMKVLVNRDRVDPVVSAEATLASGAPKAPVTEEEINSEVELMRSQDLLLQVVRANNLQHQPVKKGLLSGLFAAVLQPDAVREDLAVRSLTKALDIKGVPKSNIIDVSYTSSDAHQTFAVLNSLADLYVQKHIAIQRPPGAYEFFSRETDRFKNQLASSEQKLRDFGDSGRLAAPDLQRTALATQLASAIGQQHSYQQQMAADTQRISNDLAHLKRTSDRISTVRTVTPPSLLIQQLGGEVLKARMKRTELNLKYKPDYPLVRAADEELAAAQTAYDEAQKAQYVSESTDNDPIHEFLRQDVAKAQSDLSAQSGASAAAQAGIASLQTQMQDLDSAVIQQGDLARNVKADEQNVLLYQDKREQERVSDTLDRIRIGNVAIAVPPTVPALPVSPGFPAPLLAFAIAASLALVFTYCRAYFDPFIHEPDDLAEMPGIPVVITIPNKQAARAA